MSARSSQPEHTDTRPRVVILGGGFAGLQAAKALRRSPVRVTLIDRRNHHLFQPLLYQVATAALSPADIAAPIRRILRNQANADVVLGEAQHIDLDDRSVLLAGGTRIAYDHLVIATGATHSYFGNDHWQDAAPGLKTVEDALEIRRRILLAFEQAELECNADARRSELTFVVVGAGPTGVELAGALKEIAARSIQRDFRHIDTATARIILVEAGPRVLASMPEQLSKRAQRDLERMGVELRLNSCVTHVDASGVHIGDEFIAAENIFWAAGVRGGSIARSLNVSLDDAGRVYVLPDLSLEDHREVFVIGDIAHVVDPRMNEQVPGVCPAAIQMGRYVGRLIDRQVRQGETTDDRPAFIYRDKGTMATIGRAKAVAVVGSMRFGGLPAWLLWCFVHIYFLIGFRRRLFVMLSWAWSYLMFAKGARLITETAPQVEEEQPESDSRV